MKRLISLVAAGVLGAAMDAAPAAAQDSIRVVVQYVAGSNVYLGSGSDAGLHAGDTLLVRRLPSGATLPSLQVLTSTPDRSVVSFMGTPYSLTRGDTLAALVRHATVAPVAQRPVPVSPPEPGVPPVTSAPGAMTAEGSISLDFDALQTRTTGVGTDPEKVKRTFTTPSVGFRLHLQGLPGGLEFRTSARGSRRMSSDDLVDPVTLVQIYEATLLRRFSGFEFRLGRFYNPYEYFSGYWDGMMVHVGGESFGVGALAGYEPERGNSGFQREFPKVGAFLNLRATGDGIRYRSNLSFDKVFPRDTTPDHTFAGWAQELQVNRVSFSNSVQVDQNPASGNWVVTRLIGRLSTRLGRAGTIYGGYNLRQPYILGPVTGVIPYRRDQFNGGFSLWSGNSTVSADVSRGQQKGLSAQWAFSGSATLRSAGPSRFGAGLSGTYWTDQLSNGLLVSPSLMRRVGSADLRLNYQFYRNTMSDIVNLSHAVELGATFPLAARTQFTLRARARTGHYLQSAGLYASLWYAF